MKEKPAKNKTMEKYIHRIRDILFPLWPDAKPLLSFSSHFEMLCAVMLSAQTTDEQVEAVMPALFTRYPDAAAMAAARPEDVEALIHSVGFFRTKARHLVETAGILVRNYEGKVPSRMEKLLGLPGVGRKTANLVLSACFGKPGIIVDTHVIRVAYRLGLHGKKDPTAIEALIRAHLDEKYHTSFSHALNRHGKYVCTARAPACVRGPGLCPLDSFCPKIGVVKK